MIIHKLIIRFIKHKDDDVFYSLQARDTVRWLEKEDILHAGMTVLDLGCGHGLIGGELIKKGCRVTFADESDYLLPEYRSVDLFTIDVERDDLGSLGSYDLVICSNVLEHVPHPKQLIDALDKVLDPGGLLYLSWTNWLSPWGGHDFSPFHYLGATRGHLVYDRLVGRPRIHTPFVTLFPTSIWAILKMVRSNPRLRIRKVIPRYYPEFAFITRVPIVREFLTFNCLVLAERPN